MFFLFLYMTGGARFPFTTLMTWGLGAPDSGAIVELKKEAKKDFSYNALPFIKTKQFLDWLWMWWASLLLLSGANNSPIYKCLCRLFLGPSDNRSCPLVDVTFSVNDIVTDIWIPLRLEFLFVVIRARQVIREDWREETRLRILNLTSD